MVVSFFCVIFVLTNKNKNTMATTENKDLAIVVEYCKNNIWEWETRVCLALEKIDKWRAPLQQVDSSLYDDIMNAIEDCEADYEIDGDSIDAEEVIWVC